MQGVNRGDVDCHRRCVVNTLSNDIIMLYLRFNSQCICAAFDVAGAGNEEILFTAPVCDPI